MNEALFDQLYDASEYFRISNIYEQIKDRYMNDQLDCMGKYREMKERKESPVLANVFCMIFSFLPIMIGLGGEAMIFTLIGLFMLIGFPIINTIRCKKVSEKYVKEAEEFWNTEGGYICAEDEENYDRADRELKKFQQENQFILDFLPQSYRNYLATLYMAKAVADERAESLKEAINLYEEQLHRWEMENINREIAIQNEQVINQLSNIYDQQRRTNSQLRNIEALEFYNVVKNM